MNGDPMSDPGHPRHPKLTNGHPQVSIVTESPPDRQSSVHETRRASEEEHSHGGVSSSGTAENMLVVKFREEVLTPISPTARHHQSYNNDSGNPVVAPVVTVTDDLDNTSNEDSFDSPQEQAQTPPVSEDPQARVRKKTMSVAQVKSLETSRISFDDDIGAMSKRMYAMEQAIMKQSEMLQQLTLMVDDALHRPAKEMSTSLGNSGRFDTSEIAAKTGKTAQRSSLGAERGLGDGVTFASFRNARSNRRAQREAQRNNNNAARRKSVALAMTEFSGGTMGTDVLDVLSASDDDDTVLPSPKNPRRRVTLSSEESRSTSETHARASPSPTSHELTPGIGGPPLRSLASESTSGQNNSSSVALSGDQNILDEIRKSSEFSCGSEGPLSRRALNPHRITHDHEDTDMSPLVEDMFDANQGQSPRPKRNLQEEVALQRSQSPQHAVATIGAYGNQQQLPGGLISFDKTEDRQEEEPGMEQSFASQQRSKSISMSQAFDPTQSMSSYPRKMRQKKTLQKKKSDRTTYNMEEPVVIVADVLYIIASSVLFTLVTSEVFINWTLTPKPGVIAGNALVNLVSLVWTAQRFVVRFKTSQWEVEDDFNVIKARYLRRWFAFDAFMAIPFEFIFISWANPVYRACLCRHYLRWGRLVTLNTSTNPLVHARAWFRLLLFVVGIVFVLHLMTHVFISIDNLHVLSYGDALYFVLATVTSVGYGDITAYDGSTRLFSDFGMIFGAAMIASLTALATDIITTKDVHAAEMDKKKKMMYSMLQHYEIPWDVQREVISVFPAVLDSQSEENFRTLIGAMPASVAEKIERYLRVKLLRSLPLFHGIEVSIIYDLSSLLKRRFYDAFESIIWFGDIGVEMYFVGSGMLEVSIPQEHEDEDLVVATLRAGSWFGEMALINDAPRKATVSTILPTELLSLHKLDFDQIRKKHATLQRKIEEEATKREKDLRDKEKKQQAKADKMAPAGVDSPNGKTSPPPKSTPFDAGETSLSLDKSLSEVDDDPLGGSGANTNPLGPRQTSSMLNRNASRLSPRASKKARSRSTHGSNRD